jgi:hypothetical protein
MQKKYTHMIPQLPDDVWDLIVERLDWRGLAYRRVLDVLRRLPGSVCVKRLCLTRFTRDVLARPVTIFRYGWGNRHDCVAKRDTRVFFSEVTVPMNAGDVLRYDQDTQRYRIGCKTFFEEGAPRMVPGHYRITLNRTPPA